MRFGYFLVLLGIALSGGPSFADSDRGSGPDSVSSSLRQAAASAIQKIGSISNVYTDDARVKVTNQNSPWGAIGRLRLASGGWCTASLVAADLILTAAHCIMDEKSPTLVQGDYSFEPGYTDGVSADSSGVTYFWWGTKSPNSSRGADWAFLRLATPLGKTHGWLGVQGLDLSQHLGQGQYTMSGYSSDFQGGDSASSETGCTFTRMQSNGTVLHNCDSSRGASGAPMFYFTGTGSDNYIVALHVAEFRGDSESSIVGIPYSDDKANVAVPATTFLPTLLNIKSGS